MQPDILSGMVTMVDRIRKTERILKIWLLLANKQSGYTAKELASRFDVDERTIYRDLLSLGYELSVPVYNDKRYWKIDEKHFLPPIRFTLPEALNIYLTSRLMLAYAHRYDPNIDATFTKLNAVLPEPLMLSHILLVSVKTMPTPAFAWLVIGQFISMLES
jgi:predicted DNA-binding transcriptional regulator YafY